jgi:restriction system protein
MARRRAEFEVVLDELFSLLRMVPWWVGPIVIGVTWVGCAFVVPWIFVLIGGAFGDGDKGFARGLFNGLAVFPKIIAPYAAGVVGMVWVAALVRNFSDGARLDRQTGIESIRELSWRELEQLLAEAYKRKGYVVRETGPGADGGIDLVLEKEGEETIVQAKQWKAWKVNVKVIREFFGVQVARRAAGAIVVTSGRFTAEAERFAAENGVDLVDGEGLEALIAEVRRERKAAKAAGGAKAGQSAGGVKAGTTVAAAVKPVVCPLCSGGMVKRVAKKGARAGEAFWGCGAFPACKGTRSMV